MAPRSDIPGNFWRELKRRRVIHVITVYAAVAFVILQLVDIVSRPLNLPDWTEAFVIVVLCIGFIIAVFLSWVYDITPTGVKRTKPSGAIKQNELTNHSSPSSWKIATLISVLVIVALMTFNFINKGRVNADLSKLEKSIAVLPFFNDSPSDSNQYFINGIMEEVVSNLQKIKNFRVLSRNSVEQFRNNTSKSTPEIAKALGVSYIVEGSGQKYGNSYRLRVQLITGKNERHLWAKSYEQEIRETRDIFKVQSQIAQSIAEELNATITPEERQLINKTPTTNLTALDFFQRGREEHTKFWLDNTKMNALKNAISYYKLALKNDSSFAQAYTGLAFAHIEYYRNKVITKMIFSENELKIVSDSVENLIDKALYYNKNLEEAYLVKGWISENSELAVKEYRKALKFNPNYGLAYSNLAEALYYGKDDLIGYLENKLKAVELERGPLLINLLKELGRWYESLGFNENAFDIYNQKFQLTNDTLQYYQDMSGPYFSVGDWEKSIKWAKRILEIHPDHLWAHEQLQAIYSFTGKYDSAIYHMRRIIEISPDAYTKEFNRGSIYWFSGDKMSADSVFDKVIYFTNKLMKSGISKYYNAWILAEIYSMKDNKKKAMEYFKMIGSAWFTERWFIVLMEQDPVLQNIRYDEQFQDILSTAKSKWLLRHEKVKKWLEETGQQ